MPTKEVRDYMRKIGAKGGSQATPAQIEAAKRNGKLGGRPRKKK